MDEKVLRYNGYDVIATFLCSPYLMQELEQCGNEHTYSFTMELMEPVMFMQTRGILVDRAALERERAKVREEMDTVLQELHERVGWELNPLSSKQCQQYFYGELGIPPYTTYDKGTGKSRVSMDDEALTRIARGTASRRPVYEAELVQRYRRLSKILGTYLEIEIDRDGRMRCSYNLRGNKFGRLSSSKTVYGTGMNMQNLPDEFKRFLVPDPGYLMVEIDKARAEWVVVAYASGDANMIKVLEEGLDPHAYTAHLMTGLPIDLIKREDKLIGHTTDPGEIARLREQLPELKKARFLTGNMSLRQAGKKANHGLNYGEKARMFALTNRIREVEAKRIVDAYHEAYPGIRQWWERIKTQLRETRTLQNPFGRRYRFLMEWGEDLFKAAYSFVPQSTVADLVNTGIIRTYKDPECKPVELLAQVHDSVLFQVPAGLGPPGIVRIIQRVCEHLNPTLELNGRTFQIENEVKVSAQSWGEMHGADLSNLEDSIREHVREASRRLGD